VEFGLCATKLAYRNLFWYVLV